MIKTFLLTCVLIPLNLNSQQSYLFNKDSTAKLFKGYTNTFKNKEGTPLCFDGSVKITPSDISNLYYVEVLDSVTRPEGKINITKYLTHPDGFREKVFIDKFSFQIDPLPETVLFLGEIASPGIIDTNNCEISVGLAEPFPETSFKIREFTIIAQKRVLSIKSRKTTQQAIDFIKSLNPGTAIEIEAVYTDPLKKARRVHGSFRLL